mmetsp:Transcript_22570/g.85516  ORF Transcript_22570/g.85516 Transcript_22570/m.85516 type:complete len:257 (-) Transcript_22570:1996-2766(-)
MRADLELAPEPTTSSAASSSLSELLSDSSSISAGVAPLRSRWRRCLCAISSCSARRALGDGARMWLSASPLMTHTSPSSTSLGCQRPLLRSSARAVASWCSHLLRESPLRATIVEASRIIPAACATEIAGSSLSPVTIHTRHPLCRRVSTVSGTPSCSWWCTPVAPRPTRPNSTRSAAFCMSLLFFRPDAAAAVLVALLQASSSAAVSCLAATTMVRRPASQRSAMLLSSFTRASEVALMPMLGNGSAAAEAEPGR